MKNMIKKHVWYDSDTQVYAICYPAYSVICYNQAAGENAKIIVMVPAIKEDNVKSVLREN